MPAGRQPYAALFGLRIGAMTGALLGALVALAIGTGMVWLIVAAGAVGGFAGYRLEQRQIEHDRLQRRDRTPG
jgi:uncharacterized membrane protein